MPSYTLPELSYDFSALEPVFSAAALEIHYLKHHKGYVTNLNLALEKYQEAKDKGDLSTLVGLQSMIQFHGGGHMNHSLFWSCLCPKSKGGGGNPGGALLSAIEKNFGSLDRFVEKFSMDAVAIQGSGWCWLGYNPLTKYLEVKTTSNHGTLFEKRLLPLLIVDVWEHSYYLKYKNDRTTFVRDIWTIMDWKAVEGRFNKVNI